MSYKDIIDSLFLSDEIMDKEIAVLRDCISLSDTVSDIRNVKIKSLPFHFNVITSAARGKLRETGHSVILFDLLHHRQIRENFIRFFFPNINANLNGLIVEKEFGDIYNHIDLILYNDDFCLIIENKANNAVEQEQQIYRYVYDIAIAKLRKNIQQIYVLYLNKDNYCKPSVQSVTDVDGENNVIDSLGERFKVGNFSDDITAWLDNLKFRDEEKYLITGILQYKDYIELYCETSNIYIPMHNEIKSELIKILNLNGSHEENLNKLQNQKENIGILCQYIDDLILEEKMKPCKAFLYPLVEKIKRDFANYDVYDLQVNKNRFLLIGVGIKINGIMVNLHIEYDALPEDSSERLYYGIICPSKDYEEAYKKIIDMFKGFKDNPQKPSNNWPFWEYDDESHVYESFKALVEYAINLSKR